MLMTGLLSLNVHDALTFEGTEICLHPDLFQLAANQGNPSASPSLSNGGPTKRSLTTSSMTGGIPSLTPNASEDATTTTFTATSHKAQSSANTSLPHTGHHVHPSVSTISAGDMIEIRVWDPLPKEEIPSVLSSGVRSPGSTSTLLRKTAAVLSSNSALSVPSKLAPDSRASSTATVATTVVEVSNLGTSNLSRRPSPRNSGASASSQSSQVQPPAEAPPDTPGLLSRMISLGSSYTQNSLQYSENSSADAANQKAQHASAGNAEASTSSNAPNSGTKIDAAALTIESVVATITGEPKQKQKQKDAVTSPSRPIETTGLLDSTTTTPPPNTTKSPVNGQLLPPVFPRSRSNTAEFHPPIAPTGGGTSGTGTKHQAPHPRRSIGSNGVPLSAEHPQQHLLQHPPIIHQHGRTISGISINSAVAAASGWAVSGTAGHIASTKSPNSVRHMRDISDMTADSHALVADINEMQQQQQQQHHNRPSVNTTNTAAFQPHHERNDTDSSGMQEILAAVSSTHRLRLSFVILVSTKTLTSLKGKARTKVSLLRQVADLYNLSSYDMVTVHKILEHEEPHAMKAVSADFVLVTIKDQFISRADMHLFQKSLVGTWIYEGHRLRMTARGMEVHARQIQHGKYMAKSGIVTEDTKITFRSRSARIVWLVQLSSEMWEYTSPYVYDAPQDQNDSSNQKTPASAEHSNANQQRRSEPICELYFDRWIRFVHKLFLKWKELEVTHSLTVIFFSRTILKEGMKSRLGYEDVYGRAYEDHYKTVVENETCSDWKPLIVRIKEEFLKWPMGLGWNLMNRRPSNANQGNVLEAINVTLNMMQFHFLDRDLHRAGNSIVVISPGCGVFEVDKQLASITYQRMMDKGIGSDMLSLSLPPLHVAPFFLYSNEYGVVKAKGVNTTERYYEVPHWMHLSFVAYDTVDDRESIQPSPPSTATNSTGNPGLEGYEVTSNGFLRPRQTISDILLAQAQAHQNSNPTLTAKVPLSFSVIGNAAATPRQEITLQERQLISGRSFRDILEACRPRLAGTALPSALAMLLKMHNYAKAVQDGNSCEDLRTKFHNTQDGAPLREWGTVDFNAIASKMQRSIRSRNARLLTESPKSIFSKQSSYDDSSDADITASNDMSTTSHSSSFLGMSYDRALWTQLDSPISSKSVLQIQRSPSLEFDSNELNSISGVNGTTGENSTWNYIDGANDLSHGEAGTTKKAHADRLRRIMRMRDGSYFKSHRGRGKDAENGNLDLMYPDSDLIPIDRQESESNLSNKSGGIGAALSQFSNEVQPMGTTALEGQGLGTRTNKVKTGGILRNKSPGTPIHDGGPTSPAPFGSITIHHKDGSMGLNSPQLIPPIGDTTTSTSDRVRQYNPNVPNLPKMPTISNMSNSRPSTTKMTPMSRTSSTGDMHTNKVSSVFGSLNMKPGSYQGTRRNFTHMSSSISSHISTQSKVVPVSTSPPTSALHRTSVEKQTNPKSNIPGREHGPKSRRNRRSASSSPPTTGLDTVRTKTSDAMRSRIKLLSTSPPTMSSIQRDKLREKPGSPKAASGRHLASRRERAFNPFRQSDEDVVLSIKSHNRRRWSHVFPAGEVEFKRHPGPNWKSLTAPAILPLYVDYFPSPQELRDENTFQFNPYTITLGGVEQKQYATHKELLMEMVRQRLAQDYQLVTQEAIEESESRAESQRQTAQQGRGATNPGKANQLPRSRANPGRSFVPTLSAIKPNDSQKVMHYLSMGHRIQKLSYDAGSDSIEIVNFNKKGASNDSTNVFNYDFFLYSSATDTFSKSTQVFKKYADPYKWNKFDNMVCGEEDRWVEEGMKFRRIMFGLIPDKFADHTAEQAYIARFLRLVEYLSKLRKKDDAETALNIKIVSSKDERLSRRDEVTKLKRTTFDSMIRFNVQLRKGDLDAFEWLELAVDSVFDTCRSYRILFSWLVASSTKVEAQVQLLTRRCSQYGLNLIALPQSSVSRDMFLNSFVVPPAICIRDEKTGDLVDDALREEFFIDDGIFFTDPRILDCIDDSNDFEFSQFRSGKIRPIPSRQFIHRSGVLFVRKLRDRKGWVILVVIPNSQHSSRQSLDKYRQTLREKYRELQGEVEKLRRRAARQTNAVSGV